MKLPPDQRKHVVQEFLTIKEVGNELRRGATNKVGRLCGVRRLTVWRIWKRAVEARGNWSDHDP